MRSDVIRTYKTVHTWVGLISGMALFICFYAGGLTMFKEHLDRWATPVHDQMVWVSESQWQQLAQSVLATHPEAEGSLTLNLLPHENAPAPAVWEVRSATGSTQWRATLTESGELVTSTHQPSRMAELLDLLHRTASVPGDGHHPVGVYFMGIVSVLYFVAIVSGLIILLPTLVKDFFAIRPGKNIKRFWLDAHNVVGITSLPFHLVIAWSVIVFAFHDQVYEGMEKFVYGDVPMWIPPVAAEPTEPRGIVDLLPPSVYVDRVSALAPGFVPREITYRGLSGPRAGVQVQGEAPDHMVRSANRGFTTLDPYTAEVIESTYLPGNEDTWTTIVISFFSLHFGSFGGNGMRWVYLLLGMSGAFLFYSGNLLWIESRRRKQRKGQAPVQQRRTTELMASATVGVCWGCVAGISAAMVAGKWLHGYGDDFNTWYLWAYYLVFLGSVVWAFGAGAPRASVHLLWLCAITTLAIPLTGLIGWMLPESSVLPWLHLDPSLLLVELTALIAATIFAVMAKRMARRVREGVQDSVWGLGRKEATSAEKRVASTFVPAGEPK